MSSSLPTGRRGQLLAVALTLSVALSVWFGVAVPVIDWYDSRAVTIAQRQSLARRMADLVDRLPQLEAKATAGRSRALPANAILGGQNDAIAGAALQDLVQKMATDLKANVISEESLPAEPAGSYRKIGVRVTLGAAPWPVVVQLLAQIERSQPVMLIDDVQLRGAPLLQFNPMLQRNPGMPPLPPGAVQPQKSGPAPVDATLTVLAFRAGGPEGDQGAAPAAATPAQ